MPVRTLGGDRIGSGKKQKVYMHNYERSTHDLGFVFRSSMSAGTLVPCLVMPALPGDSFDINIDAVVRTLPTVGPLFGSFKLQLDIFNCPIRLYNKLLHNNKLGVGMNMSQVILPKIKVESSNLDFTSNNPIELQQINQSSILAYLGIRGLGHSGLNESTLYRYFNAVPLLSYLDIYKNYYANKQEEKGVYIHTNGDNILHWEYMYFTKNNVKNNYFYPNDTLNIDYDDDSTCYLEIVIPEGCGGNNLSNLIALHDLNQQDKLMILFRNCELLYTVDGMEHWHVFELNQSAVLLHNIFLADPFMSGNPIMLSTFNLSNIDTIRETLLGYESVTFTKDSINVVSPIPDILGKSGDYYNLRSSQEGLLCKTYQSDIFNNWLNTEWIDGENGISAVTSIDTSGGSFTLDTLNLSKKVYDMLNRIAVSGGTYDDWIETVYTAETFGRTETPVYCGGLSKELIFQEVVSNAATENNPLGTLAGKGIMSDKNKGGKVSIKVNEPSYIIGIVSLTPRIDYSQGNSWDVNLNTLNDLHKPALDEIGFQELLTDQMAFFDTKIDDDGNCAFKSAGKQPAWINYMTNYNKTFGNFADKNKEMYMTLNRRYEPDNGNKTIKDLTTYIDPSKYNYMFAQTNLDSQNFWTQIGFDITARRKMSARMMPNL